MADGGHHVQVEERIAVGRLRRELVREAAVGGDLRAQGDGPEAVAQLVQRGGFGPGSVANGRGQKGVGGGLQQPRRPVVVLAVARQRRQTRAAVLGLGEPAQVGREPPLQRGPVGRAERGGEERDRLRDFDQRQRLQNALEAAFSGLAGRDLAVVQARRHAGCGIDDHARSQSAACCA